MSGEAKTTTRQTAPEAEARGDQRLVVVSEGRPQYPVRALDDFGITAGDWKALIEAIFPSARTTGAVVLALSYCRARKLDIFKRPIHIVPIWDGKKNAEVETVWPGIGELRTTACRTGEWAGNDDAEFGPEVTVTFRGRTKGQYAKDVEKSVTFPAWCKLTVYRLVHGQRFPSPGPKVRWLETYATLGGTDVPNDMWETRPYGQLEKCAEAAALRRAFPEEVGGDYIPEEVGRGRGEAIDISPAPAENGSRSEALASKLKARQKPEPAGPVQVAEDLREPEPPEKTQAELVEELRALLKQHGCFGDERADALQANFGEGSWPKVVKMSAADLAVGIPALRKQLEGLAEMRAARPAEEDRGPGAGLGDE